jgi:DNA-binding transcriptional ArsR family regulator
MLLNGETCHPGVSEEAARRLTRLIGDSGRAEQRVKRLQAAADKIDVIKIKKEAEIFKALADPCRLTIISLLKDGELCVCEIMTALDRPQSSTSHHLTILKDAGLIKERKDGKWSRYRVADGAVVELINLAEMLISVD